MAKPRILIKDFLANLPLFQELEGRELARIASGTAEVYAPRGTIIFHRGDQCQGLYVVVFGQVKLVLQTPEGGEKVVDLVGPGQSFGEIAIFLDRAYMLTAETLVDTKLMHVGKATVLSELEHTPGFTRRIILNLSRQLQLLISDLEDYTLRSGTQRVIGYLLSRLPESVTGNDAAVTLPAKKGIIASRLSLTQEYFSRILHEIYAAGLIEVRGREIRIRDVERLRAYLR